jgi:hypothetical protein
MGANKLLFLTSLYFASGDGFDDAMPSLREIGTAYDE